MSKRKHRRKPKIVGYDGDPCPRCGWVTEVREHITAKELRKPFYYSRWFYCTNPRCKTRMIMPECYVVWNDNEAGRALRQRREPPPDDIVMSVLDEG